MSEKPGFCLFRSQVRSQQIPLNSKLKTHALPLPTPNPPLSQSPNPQILHSPNPPLSQSKI
ncbi:MAG: hypothetical protein ACRC62_17715 [Microcoleus sp.]